jgi:hypothetical protein
VRELFEKHQSERLADNLFHLVASILHKPLWRSSHCQPSSIAFKNQTDNGEVLGFDFYRDPLKAKKPMQTFEETMKMDKEAKAEVMATQRKLLAKRYNFTLKFDPDLKMTRGKPIATGPTARLAEGTTREELAKMTPEEIN